MDSARWNERYRESAQDWPHEPTALVAATAAALPIGTALDVACGTGRNAIYLAQQGWRVSALDFSAVAIEYARTRSAAEGVHVDWRVQDALAFRSEPRFDLIVICYLQIPVEQMIGVVRAAEQALHPGGTLLVVAHDRDNVEHGTGRPRDQSAVYSAPELAAALTIPIEIAEQQRHEKDHGPVRDGVMQIDCVVRARKPG